jgi:hypothetical protein
VDEGSLPALIEMTSTEPGPLLVFPTLVLSAFGVVGSDLGL